MELNYEEGINILQKSTILYKEAELKLKIKEAASNISEEINGHIPLFLTIMNGGLFFAAELLKQIKTPLISEYIHVSRYGNETFGSHHITWYRQPKAEEVKGKIVYILDDILDEGHTMVEVCRFLKSSGALECKIVVLIDKDLGKPKPITANHSCFVSPNKFLFGFGMDIYGLYRQLPNIYIYNS